MEKSMRRYMRVGTNSAVSYKQLGSGEGPILECLKKIVTDPYFEVVEVAHMKDAEVRKAAADMIARRSYDILLWRTGSYAWCRTQYQ